MEDGKGRFSSNPESLTHRIICDRMPCRLTNYVIGWSAGNEPVSGKLTGRYRVRAYRPALKEAKRTFNHVADLMEVRRQALKLRFWPDGATELANRQVLDLNWDWVEGIPSRDIGE